MSTTKKVTVYFNDQKGEGTWNNIDNAKTAGTSSYMSSGSSHALNGLQLFIFKWTADYLKNYVPSDATITQIYCYLSGRIKTAVGSTQRGNLQWFDPKIRSGQAYSYSGLSTNTMWSFDGTYILGGGSFGGGSLGLSLTTAQSTAVKNNGFSYGGYFSNSSAWYNYFWIAYCYASITYTQPSYYTLTINAGTGGTVTGGGTYTENTAVTIKASPNTGYKFTKWSDGNTSATRSVTVTSAATYTAYFEKLTYTVTATAGTGGTVSGGGTYEYGTSVTLIATPSDGYKFVQWSDGNTNATRIFTATGNVSLSASFALIEYTLTDNSQNGYIYDSTNSCAIRSRTYHYKDVISLVPTPNAGYTFKSWQDTGGTTNPRSYTVTGDAVLAANFSAGHKSVCYLGDIAATKIYVGDKEVVAVYIGDT